MTSNHKQMACQPCPPHGILGVPGTCFIAHNPAVFIDDKKCVVSATKIPAFWACRRTNLPFFCAPW
jgi:hypothetical protein